MNPLGGGIDGRILPPGQNKGNRLKTEGYLERRGMRLHLSFALVVVFAVLTAGCEGDLPLRMVQRDVDSVKSEVAAVARTDEGARVFIEERLKKLEGRLEKSERTRAALEEKLVKMDADLKSQSAKAAQERQEKQGFLQSQASLTMKLDELTTGARLAQGQTEEMGHGVTELNRRVDEFGRQLDQLGRRVNGFDKQVGQSVAAAQEATAAAQRTTDASQQITQQVTTALQQMAQQTNAAIEQVNTTAQLALNEARKTAKGKPIVGPTAPPRVETQPLSPAVAPVITSPPAPPVPAVQTHAQAATPPPPAVRTAESPPPPQAQAARQVARTESAGELYRNALNDYAKGNYELAIHGFRRHIELYPESSLVPNVRYWLGESYYSQKNYDQAIQELALFVQRHPENAKVASAMLKQGFAYIEMGDKIRARTVLDNLVKQFPKAQEARWAKERLSQVR
jgi:tol-pal system protein YbgF